MLSKIVGLLIFFFPLVCHGQVVDVESDRETSSEGLHGSFELGGSLQKGNVDVYQYSTALRLDYLKDAHHLFLIGSTLYGEDKGEAFQDESYGHLRWTLMSLHGVGVELFTQVQEARFKMLSLRHLVGGGARMTFLKGVIAWGGGCMSDYELLSSGSSMLVARWNTYFRVVAGGGLKMSLLAYFQPRITHLEDYRVLSQVSIEFKVSDAFSVSQDFIHTYDTMPPQGVVLSDIQTIIKLKVKL
jgi:hypothetical protein